MSTNPADEAAWEAKRTEIEDTIADGVQSARDAGVDPETINQADAQWKKGSALTDLQTKVFKNTGVIDPTTGNINVKAAVNALQKLQDSEKYGSPRLEQALGENDTLLEDMKSANRLGIKAVKTQDFLKKLGIGSGVIGGVAGAGTAAYELLKK